MPTPKVVFAILAKDLEDAARSQTLLLVLLGPILLSALFARALSDADLRRPTVAVYDPGESGLVRQLKDSDLVVLRPVAAAEEGRDLVRQGKAPVALLITADFDRQLLAGEFPRLDEVVDETSPRQVALVREGVRNALRNQANQDIPADIRVEKLREYRGGPRLSLLPAWVVFAVLSGMLVASSSMVEEKDSGTLEQILCGPARLGEVLAGKLAASWLLGFVSALLVLGLNQGLGAAWPAEVVIVGLGSLAFASMGTLVGLLAEGQAAASAMSGLLFLVLFVPTELADISQTMGRMAVWSPAYYLHDGIYRALVAGAGLPELRLHLSVLAATLVGVFILGTWRLRQHSQR